MLEGGTYTHVHVHWDEFEITLPSHQFPFYELNKTILKIGNIVTS